MQVINTFGSCSYPDASFFDEHNSDHELARAFYSYFEMHPADNSDLQQQALKLRYQVYCREARPPYIINPADFPDGVEFDDYDERSVHTLLRHKRSGVYAGTVRLILPVSGTDDNLFPIESLVGSQFDADRVDLDSIPREKLAEVSRFCLSRQFRCRKGEGQWADGVPEVEVTSQSPNSGERRVAPHPVLGLLVAMVRMSWEMGIEYWYASMEPRLERRVQQFGFFMKPISPLIDYYGLRRAYIGYLPEIVQEIYKHRRDVWTLMTDNGRMWPCE